MARSQHHKIVLSFGCGQSGLEFKHDSICTRTVDRSSKVNTRSPTNPTHDLTPASHSPPKCGAEGGLKRHVIPLSTRLGMCQPAISYLHRQSLSRNSYIIPDKDLVSQQNDAELQLMILMLGLQPPLSEWPL